MRLIQFRTNRGFTILEILIATGLMSGLALFVSEIGVQSSKIGQSTQIQTDLENLDLELKHILKDRPNCMGHSGLVGQTLVPSTPQNTSGFAVTLPSGGNLLAPGLNKPGYQISATRLSNLQPLTTCAAGGAPCRYLASLSYDVQMPNKIGATSVTRERPLEITTAPADADDPRAITECAADDGTGLSEQEICEAMNGTYFPNGTSWSMSGAAIVDRHCSFPITMPAMNIEDTATCESCWGANNDSIEDGRCNPGDFVVGLSQVSAMIFTADIICGRADGSTYNRHWSPGVAKWYQNTAWSLQCPAGQKAVGIGQSINTATTPDRIRVKLYCRNFDSTGIVSMVQNAEVNLVATNVFGPSFSWNLWCPDTTSSAISGFTQSRIGTSTNITMSCW